MQKLSARERRHKAVLNKIARLTLARNQGIKAIVAAETQLPALERQARRNELPVKPRKPKPEPVQAVPHSEAHPHSKKGPQRKRKADHDEALSPDAHIADIRTEEADREARLVAMGFRKTKRKGATIAP